MSRTELTHYDCSKRFDPVHSFTLTLFSAFSPSRAIRDKSHQQSSEVTLACLVTSAAPLSHTLFWFEYLNTAILPPRRETIMKTGRERNAGEKEEGTDSPKGQLMIELSDYIVSAETMGRLKEDQTSLWMRVIGGIRQRCSQKDCQEQASLIYLCSYVHDGLMTRACEW